MVVFLDKLLENSPTAYHLAIACPGLPRSRHSLQDNQSLIFPLLVTGSSISAQNSRTIVYPLYRMPFTGSEWQSCRDFHEALV
jgi:hypothetical protein